MTEEMVRVESKPLVLEYKNKSGEIQLRAEVHMFGVVITEMSGDGSNHINGAIETWKTMVDMVSDKSGHDFHIGNVYAAKELAHKFNVVMILTSDSMVGLLDLDGSIEKSGL